MGINPFEVPELRQLWFVRVLFMLVIVSPILKFISEKLENVFHKGILAILWIFWAAGKFLLPRYIPSNVWQFLNFGFLSFEGTAFFMSGIYLQSISSHDYLQSTSSHDSLLNDYYTGVALLITGMFIIVARWPLCFAIPLLLVGVFLIVPNCPLPKCLHGLHFPLYLVHLNVVFVYFALLDNSEFGKSHSALLDPGVSVAGECICFLCVMIVSLGICFVLKRLLLMCPTISILIFGGRK